MEIIDECGLNIFVLPDSGICTVMGLSPLKMEACPTSRYDFFGDICCPGDCPYYTEELAAGEKWHE